MKATGPDRYDLIVEVQKFNPYHDALGRFSTASGAASFTWKPGKSKAHDLAIQRAGGKVPGMEPKKQPNPYGDPEKIGGADRGKPMSREEANEGRVNPKFGQGYGYTHNCQSCVVAFEARLRGYDVTAKSRANNPAANHIASNAQDAWIDPATGKPPAQIRNPLSVTTQKRTRKWLETNVDPNARYVFRHGWKNKKGGMGHIVCIDRDSAGNLRVYDPQNGKTYQGKDLDDYLGQVKTVYQVAGVKYPRAGLIRVDNMRINPGYADGIMEVTK